jgi:hypothetical protein
MVEFLATNPEIPGSIFWEAVGLEQGPLNLVSTTEELLGRKSSGSGLESREYGCRDPSRWLCGKLLSAKVATNFAHEPFTLTLIIKS